MVVEANEKEPLKINNSITKISQNRALTFGVLFVRKLDARKGKMTKAEELQINNDKAEYVDPQATDYY